MDEQVTVFLYSIRRFSSFTLSSAPDPLVDKPYLSSLRNFRPNAVSGRRYHFCVLKNEETLFLMMKRRG
jgi:hypothetical protein